MSQLHSVINLDSAKQAYLRIQASAQRKEALEARNQRIYALRVQGFTCKEIAAIVGLTTQSKSGGGYIWRILKNHFGNNMPIPDAWRGPEEARMLHDEKGWSYVEIAKYLGFATANGAAESARRGRTRLGLPSRRITRLGPDNTFWCSGCTTYLDRCAFNAHRKSIHNVQSRCRKCRPSRSKNISHSYKSSTRPSKRLSAGALPA